MERRFSVYRLIPAGEDSCQKDKDKELPLTHQHIRKLNINMQAGPGVDINSSRNRELTDIL